MTASGKTAVALGCFDGLHLGHAAVISAAFRDFPGEKAVLSVCRPGRLDGGKLLPDGERSRLLAEMGADAFLAPPFDVIRNDSPREFVQKILIGELGAARVACGFNYRFGAVGAGTAETLAALASEFDLACVIVPPVEVGGQMISSTALRGCLQAGDIEAANAMLGRCYGYTLPVLTGQKLGRTLGAPTINQHFDKDIFLPRFGVYASRTFVDGKWMYSVTNIGVRPTVGSPLPLSETWVPDWRGDVYGQELRVELLKFRRDEQKFPSIEALREAIHADGDFARQTWIDLSQKGDKNERY